MLEFDRSGKDGGTVGHHAFAEGAPSDTACADWPGGSKIFLLENCERSLKVIENKG